ncbi:unnamed protein product [Zymoseptoria tritici ST99CH_1A5]|uniref:Palmitoyltransferase n=1 Tax=Zymoseptoria tritici ST99CH_1A5 TaxID=1276529 RepID=A0A1Y6LKG9_ZYMTR|nr:unnamed protein product [Zymoseptoria tritici ST99CH_1A5]
MASREASRPSSPGRRDSGSAPSSPTKDGLDKVELSDLDASPPQLPIESDLMQLARLGELRAIQKLFDSGRYTARSTDEQGITALHWAAINGHHALCHFLVQSGADVNAKGGDAQATPVLWASKKFNLQVISLLLTNGADPLIRDDQGYNLLHSATLDGNVYQLILLLYQSDIPVDVQDAQGHTSLMWAAYKGFPACIDVLLRFGADVHATDDMGFTSLHWALVKGNYLGIQKLIEAGSDRFAKSKPTEGETEGDTPSMTASKMKSDRQWRKALLESGYDEHGCPQKFPIPMVHDRRLFFQRFFFLWPFALGGLQLHMLAYLNVWVSVPGVLIVGYGLQFAVQKLLRWAPSDMNSMHKTPFLAGVFAATLFWVAVRFIFKIFPNTLFSNFFLTVAFTTCMCLTTYFYTMTMTADPGFIPKGASRGQTKKTIDELVEHNAFNEAQFCTTCMIRKPLRSKHCRRCGRCVAREDHHCPWVDNCIAVNNHKHFILYILSMVAGIALLIRLFFAYLTILPAPTKPICTFLNPELCAEFEKDPLTLVTTAWASVQLTWTVMLVFVQFFQVARNLTTFESMRNTDQVGPILSAITTGTMSMDDAQVTGPAAGSSHKHAHRKKEGCFARWSKLLGIDTFLTIAFQGYNGAKDSRSSSRTPRRKQNPFSRGVVRNCQDFWCDGPVFGRKVGNEGLVGGERVDYGGLYDVPGGGARGWRGYEAVPGMGVEEGV